MIESNNLHYLKLKRSNFNAISKNNISTDLVSPVIDIRNSSHNVLFNNNITSHLWNTNLNIDGESHNNTVCENNFLCPAYTTLNSSDYFYSNKEIVSIDSTAFSNFWENNRVGNYWQNYHGSDANGDGIGDTPYAIDGDNVDNYPLMYPFDIEGDAVVLPPPEPFPTTLIIVAVIVVGVVLAIYLKKRKHQTGMVEVK
jgi:nitrous oxidase accessory protein NosD